MIGDIRTVLYGSPALSASVENDDIARTSIPYAITFDFVLSMLHVSCSSLAVYLLPLLNSVHHYPYSIAPTRRRNAKRETFRLKPGPIIPTA